MPRLVATRVNKPLSVYVFKAKCGFWRINSLSTTKLSQFKQDFDRTENLFKSLIRVWKEESLITYSSNLRLNVFHWRNVVKLTRKKVANLTHLNTIILSLMKQKYNLFIVHIMILQMLLDLPTLNWRFTCVKLYLSDDFKKHQSENKRKMKLLNGLVILSSCSLKRICSRRAAQTSIEWSAMSKNQGYPIKDCFFLGWFNMNYFDMKRIHLPLKVME